ncbi:MAG: hypothetical protein HRF51_02480 [bacterium]|jgi:hypothetical protein
MKNPTGIKFLSIFGKTRGLLPIFLFLQLLLLCPILSGDAGQAGASRTSESLNAAAPPGGDFGMTSGDAPEEGTAVYLNMPAVIGGNNIDTSRPDTRAELLRFSLRFDFAYNDLLTTAAVISPEKASEFTLVGAKPSGTM